MFGRLLYSNHEEYAALLISIAVILGSFIYFALPTEPSLVVIGIMLFFALMLCLFLTKFRMMAICMTALLIEIIFATARTRVIAKNFIVKDKLFVADIIGIIADINSYSTHSKILIKPTSQNKKQLPKYIRLTVRQLAVHLNIGDIIRTSAVLLPPPHSAYQDSYNFRTIAYLQSIGAVGYSTTKPVVLSNNRHAYIINRIRDKIDKRLFEVLSSKHAPIASALITGKKTKINLLIKQNINNAGIAHLLAISGLHMVMISSFVFKLSRALMACSLHLSIKYNIKKISAVIAVIVGFLYLLLSGHPISAQRAFIFSILFYAAIILDKGTSSKHTMMFAAMIILFVAPESIMQPSFQLSFTSVCAILITHEFSRNFKHNLINQIVFIALHSVMITIITAPYLIYHFNSISILGIITNIVAIPLTSYLLLPACLFTVVFMWSGTLAKFFALIVGNGIEVLIRISSVASKAGSIKVKHIPIDALAIISAGILFAFLSNKQYKAYAIIFIVPGLILWYFHTQPDMLLYGNNIAIANINKHSNLILLSGRKNSFVVRTWQQKYAATEVIKQTKQQQICDYCGCFYEKKKSTILLTKNYQLGSSALQCNADIIINTAMQNVAVSNFSVVSYKHQPVFLYLTKKGIAIKTRSAKQRPWLY